MTRLFFSLVSLLCFLPVSARTQADGDGIAAIDTALLNIYKQLMIFPQEKIHIQTDKPYYIAGETVFFRLFLLDACFHVPFFTSRYVYVELIDQNNSVEIRLKLRPEEGGMFYSSVELPKHLAQGYYRIRAYTRYMENRGIENFYSKPVYVIAENREYLEMEMNASAHDKRHTLVELRFTDVRTGEVKTPGDLFVQLNGRKQKASDRRDDGVFEFELPLTDSDRERCLYVEVLNNNDSVVFKRFDAVPYTDDSIELAFYPEGGYLVDGQTNIVAFKALQRDGRPAGIEGRIVASDSTVITQFSTRHEGMGAFFLIPEKGRAYHVEYESGGRQYRMPFPDLKRSRYSLHATRRNGNLSVSLNREADAVLPEMYLLAHCRGDVVYFNRWDHEKNILTLPEALFRSGITHLLLLSRDYRPLGERLVFINRNDHIMPEIRADKQTYKSREHIVMDISINDMFFDFVDSIPYDREGMRRIELPEVTVKGRHIGKKAKSDYYNPDMSISVTADNDVQIDTATNILTQILLESELRGFIPNPAYYFRDDPDVAYDADLLMMTHGWTRYDISRAMRGEWTAPAIDFETSQTLTGKVTDVLIPRRTASKIEVSVMSYRGKEKYYAVTRTDENGRFRFDDFELPDSSEFVVQALKGEKRKKGLLEVVTDTIEYPPAGDFGIPQYCLGTANPFVDKMIAGSDRQYTYFNGMKVIRLPEVIVRAKNPNRKPAKENIYNIQPDFFLTAEDIAETGIKDVLDLIAILPGVTVRHRGWQTAVEVERNNYSGSTLTDVSISRENGGEHFPVWNSGEQNENDSPYGQDFKNNRLGSRTSAMLAINGVFFQEVSHLTVLSMVNVNEIGEIHLINNYNKLSHQSDGTAGVIDIITKDGLFYNRRQRFHFKSLTPLGYAASADFYSPKYDTPEAIGNKNPDLRTTIYWKPNIVVNGDGAASVNFYTADTHTTYSVVVEGIYPNGTLIYGRKQKIINVK